MIGFFPDPYPDELIYSVCARYHSRVGYRSREPTCRDLFGSARVKVAVDLPSNLDALVARLPRINDYTVDEFIDSHTLLTFYGPFIPSARLQQLRADMRGAGGKAVHGRIGILTSNIGAEFLRFCPLCVETDRERFGETYWHRLHQAPGVEVCLIHKVFLKDSSAHTRLRGSREAFVTAEERIYTTPEDRSLNDANPCHLAYLRIAEDANWLLSQPGLKTKTNIHRERYINLLINRGFATHFGKVNSTVLVNALSEYYSPAFLEGLRCNFERKYNWLHRLIHNRERSQHPLQHLLLMQFLECTTAEFFQLPARQPMFGVGPWPCLNRASEHFGQSLIPEFKLTATHRGDKRPRGTFRCDHCGFAYYRFGPDQSEEARYEISGYASLGEVWENTFKRLYKEGTSNKEIAARLDVPLSLVLREIKGLKEAISSSTELAGDGTSATTHKAVDPNLREEYRKQWLAARKADPGAGRVKLKSKILTVTNWLYKYDREWVEANSPARLVSTGPPTHIDWEDRDKELERLVRDEAKRILDAPGKPIRVSSTGVAKNIGHLTMIRKNADKLPLTMKVLEEISESVEDYAVRRVQWAAERYWEEGISPARWELQLRATMLNEVAKRPVVKAAIDAAWSNLELLRINQAKVRDFNVTTNMSVGATPS